MGREKLFTKYRHDPNLLKPMSYVHNPLTVKLKLMHKLNLDYELRVLGVLNYAFIS